MAAFGAICGILLAVSMIATFTAISKWLDKISARGRLRKLSDDELAVAIEKAEADVRLWLRAGACRPIVNYWYEDRQYLRTLEAERDRRAGATA